MVAATGGACGREVGHAQTVRKRRDGRAHRSWCGSAPQIRAIDDPRRLGEVNGSIGHHGQVRLYHITDDGPAIVAVGFDPDARRDRSIPKGLHWLADSLDGTSSGYGRAHLVSVEVPDEIAARYLYRFEDGTVYTGNYLFPTEVINTYRQTFRWEPIDRCD